MKKLIGYSMWMLVMIALVGGSAGCLRTEPVIPDEPQTPENPGGDDTPVEAGDARIIFRLDTPHAFTEHATRALTVADEDAVSELHVLIFDESNTLIDLKKTESDAITLPRDNARVEFMLLANAGRVIDATIGMDVRAMSPLQRSYAQIVEAIEDEVTEQMYHNAGGLPMWGRTGMVQITQEVQEVEVKLLRSVARVDVRVDDGVPFELTEIYVMRPNSSYRLIPHDGCIDEDRVTRPSVPVSASAFSLDESSARFRFEVENGSKRIYIPETLLSNGTSGDAGHMERMAVVVGGRTSEGGEVSYYRLDFLKDSQLCDVLRNHVYRFTITDVPRYGHATPQDAYASLVMNGIVVDVVDWANGDDGYMDGITVWPELPEVPEPQTPVILDTRAMLAPPGVLGVTKGGKLTLRGAKEYAGTPVETHSEFGPLESESVYMVYFKHSSLIAILGGEQGDRFDPSDVVWSPFEYTSVAEMRRAMATETRNDAYKLIPCDDQMTWTEDPENGLGDPCEYADKGTATGDWGIPQGTTSKWRPERLVYDGSYFADTDVAKFTLANGEEAIGFVSGLHPDVDWSMFLPMAGYRMMADTMDKESTGQLYGGGTEPGARGFYWSYPGSWSAAALHFELMAGFAGYPNGYFLSDMPYGISQNGTTALPIRCIRRE